jgi:alpha-glucosidase
MSNGNWWRGGVIYQIYPRSFLDTDRNGVGDLAGIAQKLDYVASLGVDAIWISPFMKSPMKDFGYDVSDYKSVDPIFGNLDDFKALLDRAHSLGLKVLIDMVWSHSSDQHDWFKESAATRDNPKADWYVWADPKADGTAPNNWLSWFGGPAWTWSAKRRQYYLHHFLKEQPALTLWNPEVRAAIKDTAAFWLDMGVDGFRLDVANLYLADRHLRDNPARPEGEPLPADPPPSNPIIFQIRQYSVNQPENLELVEEIRAFVDQWPERCLLAEAGCCEDSELTAAQYTQKNKRFSQAYSFTLLASNMGKHPIWGAVTHVESIVEDGWLCWATSNHDFARPVSRMAPPQGMEKDAALLNMAVGLSLRGSYCMFQGEELGLPQAQLAFEELVDPYDIALYPEHAGRDGSRTPIPWKADAHHAGFSDAQKTWLPVYSEHVPLSVDRQEADADSVLRHYRQFIHFRRDSEVLKSGSIQLIEAHSDLLVFERALNEERILCLYNISAYANSLELKTIGYENVSCIPQISRGSQLEELHLDFAPYGYAFLRLAA